MRSRTRIRRDTCRLLLPERNTVVGVRLGNTYAMVMAAAGEHTGFRQSTLIRRKVQMWRPRGITRDWHLTTAWNSISAVRDLPQSVGIRGRPCLELPWAERILFMARSRECAET